MKLFRACLLFLPCLLPSSLLAQDAPEERAPERRGLVLNAEGAYQGYTLIAPLFSRTIHLLDMEGRSAHTWTTETPPAGGMYLLDDGSLLRAGRMEDGPRFHGGGIGGVIERIGWDSRVLWRYVLSDDEKIQHHDLEPLPNGNVLAIIWEHRFPEDAVAWGRDPEHVGEEGFWTDAVLEIQPIGADQGRVVWEWHAWDHVVQDFDETKENWGSVVDHPELIDINADHRDEPPITPEEAKRLEEIEKEMRALGYAGGPAPEPKRGDRDRGPGREADWLHTNAVEYLPEQDLIVLSTPHLNELWIIDHGLTTEEARWHSGGRFGRGGDLLWRWGNPKNYGAGDETHRRLFYQHDPQLVPGTSAGELRITVFNNGRGRPEAREEGFSSVDELVLPFVPKTGFTRGVGQAFGPTAPAWTYSDEGTFYSPFISGAHRLPNGNTMICQGVDGRAFEVTQDGRIVWDFVNPHGGDVAPSERAGRAPPTALFRVTRIGTDHPALAGREL